MSSISLSALLNSSFIDAVVLYVHNITLSFADTVLSLQQKDSVTTVFDSFVSLHYTDFQWTLLHGFALILLVNLLLICVAWRYYGKNICERFMKPATSKSIEELKASVSRLKLPKEHTPRI